MKMYNLKFTFGVREMENELNVNSVRSSVFISYCLLDSD